MRLPDACLAMIFEVPSSEVEFLVVFVRVEVDWNKDRKHGIIKR